jgi:hypothetical protein
MKPEVDDVTFCREGCGQNLHEKCMDTWKKSHTAAKCPMCRKTWKTDLKNVITLDEKLDQEGMQIYVNWLYSGNLHIYKADLSDQAYNLLLLKGLAVSEALGNDKFKHAIIAEYVSSIESEGNLGFDLECFEYAYYEHSDWPMRCFMVDAFLVDPDLDNIGEIAQEYPTQFMQDLCIAAVKLLKAGMKKNDLLKNHANGEFELQGNPDDVYTQDQN